MTPHCAVSLSLRLTGDGGQPAGLYYWIYGGHDSDDSDKREPPLQAGDITILARGVLHGVRRVARKGQPERLVMVFFY